MSAVLGLMLVVAIGAMVTLWRVQSEKNSEFLRGRVLGALSSALGAGHDIAVEEAGLTLGSGRPKFSISGMAVKDQKTGAAAELGAAEMVLDPFSLWRLAPEPTLIRFDGLRIILPQSDAPLAPGALLPAIRGLVAGLYVALNPAQGPFPALKAVEGRNIELFRRNAAGGLDALRGDLFLTVNRRSSGDVAIRLGHESMSEPLVIDGQVREGEGVTLEAKNLTAGALFALLGARPEVLDPALRIDLRIAAGRPQGGVAPAASLALRLHGGIVTLPDPDIPPFHLDDSSLDLSLADQNTLRIEALRFRSGDADIRAEGALHTQPEGDYRLRLAAREPVLGRLSAGEPIPVIEAIAAEGVVSADLMSFRLDRADIQVGEGRAQVAGRYSLANGGLVETSLQAQDIDLRAALRIWPISVAPQIRTWLVERGKAGTVRSLTIASSLAGQALKDAFAKKPIPEDSLRLAVHLSNVTLQALDGAPPLMGAELKGEMTGRRVSIAVPRATMALPKWPALELRDGEFLVADLAAKPVILELRLPVSGQVPALLDLLATPPLRTHAPVPANIAISAGVFEGSARVFVPLVPNGQPPQSPRVEMRAEMRDIVVDNVIKGEKLERGIFSFTSRGGVTIAKGEGRMLGAATQLEFRAEPDKVPQLVAKLVVDDALRQRRGMDMRPAISGPAQASFTLRFPRNAAPVIEAEFDLQRMRVTGPIPGIAKAPGEAGRLKFQVNTRPDGTVLDNIDLSLGAVQARGKVEFGKDGQFLKADLPNFRLSAGDFAALQVERNRALTKIQVRGNAFDIRPFLKGLQAGKTEDGKAGDFDLSIRTTVLVGFNGELMNGADLILARKAGRLSQLRLAARFGNAPVVAETTDAKPNSVLLRIDSADAGATLRFLDVYSRMQSGQLNAEITVGATSQNGLVQVRDFHIRGEPALRQFAGSVASGSGPMRPSGPVVRGDEVQFTKLRADFSRNTGRFDLQEAVMWGAQVGGSLEGYINYAGDKVDLKGVLVPAYALNNIFAQIPILGPIFGGSQYEGLFAVPFVITGKASAPVLRTNPVSVIAPGIFRKFFELQREGTRR